MAVVGPRRKPIFSFARTGGCQLGNESLRAGRWMLAEEVSLSVQVCRCAFLIYGRWKWGELIFEDYSVGCRTEGL